MPKNDNLAQHAEGYDAAGAGQAIADNPYESGPGQWQASDWRAGFIAYFADLMALLMAESKNIEDAANEAADPT